MSVARLLTDLSHAVACVTKEEMSSAARRCLLRDYAGFRWRAVCNHRLGTRLEECRVLGNRIRFLDASWFHTSFTEVFLEQEYFFRADHDRPTIVDCGSNIGLAVFYFKWLYPQARIIAFEPHSLVFATLKQNVESNGLTEVTLINAAVVGSAAQQVELFYDPAHPGDLCASIDPAVVQARQQPLESMPVRAERLSQQLPEVVDLLKLDIEGAEFEVLVDLRPRLSQVKQILIETHVHPAVAERSFLELLNLLAECGFSYVVRSNLQSPLARARNLYYNLVIYAYRQHQ